MAVNADIPDFEAFAALLPFYINGTLGASEREALEAALRQSSRLRAELEAEQAVATWIKTGGNAMTSSTPDNQGEKLEALLGRIDSEGRPIPEPLTVAATPPSREEVRSLMSYLNPRRWHPAMALSLIAVAVGQSALIGGQAATIASLEKENFALASGPCAEEGKGGIQIELNENALWTDTAALLDKEGLTVARSGDFGTLTLSGSKKGAELEAQLTRLRASPLVSSAEPAA